MERRWEPLHLPINAEDQRCEGGEPIATVSQNTPPSFAAGGDRCPPKTGRRGG
jgi:hypothetical protein